MFNHRKAWPVLSILPKTFRAYAARIATMPYHPKNSISVLLIVFYWCSLYEQIRTDFSLDPARDRSGAPWSLPRTQRGAGTILPPLLNKVIEAGLRFVTSLRSDKTGTSFFYVFRISTDSEFVGKVYSTLPSCGEPRRTMAANFFSSFHALGFLFSNLATASYPNTVCNTSEPKTRFIFLWR